MRRLPDSANERVETKRASGKLFSPFPTDRQIILLTILSAAIVLLYFYAVNRGLLSNSRMSPIFRHLLIAHDSKTAELSFGVCILAAYWRNPLPFLKIVDFVGSHQTFVSMAAVALLGFGAVFVYHNDAFSMDEYAAVFQSKVFAAGRLTGQLPPSVVDWLIPRGFNGAFLVASRTTGQAIESYWPGFSVILAPFEFFGISWLCNSCLAGISILLIHRITLEITDDRRAAGWSVLFTIASGAFAAYAISYYSMQAHMTANLLFVWLLLKPTRYRAFSAGVVGSLALVLHNPFPHTLFAAPWIIAMARSREQRRFLPMLMLGYLPLTIPMGVGWLYLRELISSGNSAFNILGATIGQVFRFPDKSMVDIRIAEVVKLWIWAVPSLLILALLGRLRCGNDHRVRLLCLSAVVTFIGYIFVVFDQGHGWGYRYFQSAWGVVPILAACAMTARAEPNARLSAYTGALALLNLLLIVPVQLIQIDDTITRHSAQLPKSRKPGSNVYFINDGGFYLADLVQTDPLLRSDDLFLFSRGPDLDAELRRQNWPNAVLVEGKSGVEEWNLGASEQRHTSAEFPRIKRFLFSYSELRPGS